MADTKNLHVTAEPVEGDGVSYRGIVWFVVILTATTVFCQLLVWGGFVLMERVHVTNSGVVRSPLAMPSAKPSVNVVTNTATKGQLMSGLESDPNLPTGAFKPGLLVDEPSVLANYHRQEQLAMTTYGWVDKATGVVRLPIDRAKALVLERGLPARSERPAGAQPLPELPTPQATSSRDAAGSSAAPRTGH